MSDILISQNEAENYDDFVSQLRKTSDKMETMKSWNDRRNRDLYLPQQPSHSLDDETSTDPMDWESAQTVSVTAQRYLR